RHFLFLIQPEELRLDATDADATTPGEHVSNDPRHVHQLRRCEDEFCRILGGNAGTVRRQRVATLRFHQ
ncbi:MAG TPA: hypothetical protein VKF17_19965, partial [Isosphaeraceae bacterium]|nr:hypothetical protein [Isosphaeraceae bacterium]